MAPMSASDLRVQIHFEDGTMWATVESMPGVFATGDTLEELRESLTEGIAFYLAEEGQEPPAINIESLAPIDTAATAAIIRAA